MHFKNNDFRVYKSVIFLNCSAKRANTFTFQINKTFKVHGLLKASPCLILKGRHVTLRRVRATTVAVTSNSYYVFWMCVCSLWYPARNAHAPYYIFILGPVRLYHTFLHYVINGMNFWGKNLSNIKGVFWFSLKLLSTASVIPIQRDIVTNVHIPSCTEPVTVVRF